MSISFSLILLLTFVLTPAGSNVLAPAETIPSCPPAVQLGGRHDMKLQITGLDGDGDLVIAIWDKPTGFLKVGYEFEVRKLKVKGKRLTVVFKDLPVGEYAVSFFHDANQNGECDRNFLGIPTEGIGFSRLKKKKWTMPLFKEHSVKLTQHMELEIPVLYYL
jgi:uncharacterized protein (DUF2141 family)